MTIRTDLYGGLPSLLANREHLSDVSDVSDKELAVLEEHDLSYADMARFSDTLLSEIGGAIHGAADILAELSHQIGYREGYGQAVFTAIAEKGKGAEK